MTNHVYKASRYLPWFSSSSTSSSEYAGPTSTLLTVEFTKGKSLIDPNPPVYTQGPVQKICEFFRLDKCQFGDDCRNAHDVRDSQRQGGSGSRPEPHSSGVSYLSTEIHRFIDRDLLRLSAYIS
jgi:hypothetical protein